MQFPLLVYESPEAFATRNNNETDPYIDAWRAYYKALVEAGIYGGGDPLEVPETGTTVRLKEGKRPVQDGPYADTKEQIAGFIILELSSLDAALDWAARCPAASAGAVEVRLLAPESKRALKRAKEAAKGKDVRIGGGVSVIRQYLIADEIDEMHLAVSPALPGEGESLQTPVHPLQDRPWGKCNARPPQKEIVVAFLGASDSVLRAIRLE